LAVRLQRQRPVAVNLDPIEVDAPEHAVTVSPAANDRCYETRNVASADVRRRGEGEPVLEARTRGDPQRHRAGIRVRIAVRDEHEGGAADALDLQRRLPAPAPLAQHLQDHPHEGEVAGTGPAGIAAELVE